MSSMERRGDGAGEEKSRFNVNSGVESRRGVGERRTKKNAINEKIHQIFSESDGDEVGERGERGACET